MALVLGFFVKSTAETFILFTFMTGNEAMVGFAIAWRVEESSGSNYRKSMSDFRITYDGWVVSTGRDTDDEADASDDEESDTNSAASESRSKIADAGTILSEGSGGRVGSDASDEDGLPLGTDLPLEANLPLSLEVSYIVYEACGELLFPLMSKLLIGTRRPDSIYGTDEFLLATSIVAFASTYSIVSAALPPLSYYVAGRRFLMGLRIVTGLFLFGLSVTLLALTVGLTDPPIVDYVSGVIFGVLGISIMLWLNHFQQLRGAPSGQNLFAFCLQRGVQLPADLKLSLILTKILRVESAAVA